jgi:hypothetical protein
MKNGLSPTLPERGGRKEEGGTLNVENRGNSVGAQCLRPEEIIKINVSPKRAGVSITPLQRGEIKTFNLLHSSFNNSSVS